MGNNITVAITADVADLTAKMALARVAVSDTTKELTKQARAANGEMTPALLAAADAAAKEAAGQAMLGRQYKAATAELVAAKSGAVAATSAMSGLSHGSAGVTRELLVMGRELSRGNFNRMAGSATILAGRLGVLTPSVLMTAGAIALLAAPAIAFGLAAYQGSEQLTKMQNAMKLTNGYAGVTIAQLQNLSKQLSSSTNISIGEATATMTRLAASGRFTGDELLLVGQNATIMGKLTGESADKFMDEFEKMGGDVAKFAADFAEHYHSLSAAQIDHIRLLENEGRSAEAQLELQKDLYTYLGQNAPQELHGLEGAFVSLEHAISHAWDSAMAFSRVMEGIGSTADQIRVIDAQMSRMQSGSSVGRFGLDVTGLANLQKQRDALVAQQKAEESAADAKGKKAQVQADGIAAAAKLSEKFEASKTSGEKLKKAIADINDELAKAKAANPANAALYEQQAAAARSQAQKSDTPHAAMGPKGTSAVAEWTEQLRAQEIASKNYYGDATEAELKFWQGKVGLTTAGSKDWLAVQGKIYEASKSLARQAYQDKIADLNESLGADRDNWTKERADWQAKLAYIRSTFGEEGTEYKNAYREFERAQQDHAAKELRAAQDSARAQTDELKRTLETQAKAREDNARAAETVVKGNAGATPFGEIAAQRQLAEIHRQVTEQQIADNETLHNAETSSLDTSIAAAVAKYGDDKAQYQHLLDEKAAADQQYAAKKQQLDAQMRMQSIQDIQAMQTAYAGYISGTVNASVTGFSKMIGGQMSWRNMGIGIYQSLVQQVEQQVEKMVTNWIVKHLLMSTAQRAQLAVQQAAQTGAAAASTATTLATTKAQVALLAGLAGAGGVASMAAAPWPMDMTAPAFGAQMAATAISMGSFAVGTNVVPNDMVAQIHAGERIIPKADNDRLLSLTERGAGAAGGGGGTNHYHTHYSPVVNGQMPFADQLDAHEGAVNGRLQRAARRGVRFA